MSETLAGPPVFDETIAGALIDAARINVMAARTAFDSQIPLIAIPGDADDVPTLAECLAQAATWLDAARAITITRSPAEPTSIHVVAGKSAPIELNPAGG